MQHHLRLRQHVSGELFANIFHDADFLLVVPVDTRVFVVDAVVDVAIRVACHVWIKFMMEELLFAELDPDVAQALYIRGQADMPWVRDYRGLFLHFF